MTSRHVPEPAPEPAAKPKPAAKSRLVIPAAVQQALGRLHVVSHMTYDSGTFGWHTRLEGHVTKKQLDALTVYLKNTST